MICFPWPPNELSPNVKAHWAVKARAAKKYKADCVRLLWAWGLKPQPQNWGLCLVVSFYPPDRRRRDVDNMLASFKYGIDAVAYVSCVDDSNFEIIPRNMGPSRGGRVEVMLSRRAIRPAKAAA